MDNIIQQITSDKKLTLIYSIYLIGFFLFPFVICAFVVSGASNAGFNVVLTAILNIGFVAEAYYILMNSKTPIAIGFLIGSSCMITCLNLMTAVYWGQLSHCQVSDIEVAQYSCDNPSAYGATSTFATFLFIVQLFFSSALIHWRGELISEAGLYDEISVPNASDNISYDGMMYNKSNTTNNNSSSHQKQKPPISTDL